MIIVFAELVREKLSEEELTEQPFYGIWCYASKDSDEAGNYAERV